MMKLICLEWKKNNIKKYIRNAVIFLIVFCTFMFAQNFLGIASDSGKAVGETVHDCNSTIMPIELFSSWGFLVFAGVMFSSFIVSSFKNKNINLMFSYPIKRQKILLSQILAVWIFCLISLVLTKLCVYSFILLCSKFMVSDFLIDYDMLTFSFYFQLVLKSIITVSMSLVSLFIGLIMKSSKATIVTSCLLIFILQGTIGEFSFSNSCILPLILIAISLLAISIILKDIEKKDLM